MLLSVFLVGVLVSGFEIGVVWVDFIFGLRVVVLFRS